MPNKTKAPEEAFKLRLKGGQPKLSEVKADTSLGSMNKEEAMKRKASMPVSSGKDEIDIAI